MCLVCVLSMCVCVLCVCVCVCFVCVCVCACVCLCACVPVCLCACACACACVCVVCSGYLGEFVSIFLHIVERCVYVSCDGGRLCRPLIILDPATHLPRLTERHIAELAGNLRDFASLIREGIIECVAACLLALLLACAGPLSATLGLASRGDVW